jgi:hypothetical protein
MHILPHRPYHFHLRPLPPYRPFNQKNTVNHRFYIKKPPFTLLFKEKDISLHAIMA